MIRKTQKIKLRRVPSWVRGYTSDATHVEKIIVETWWFCGVLPIYSRERIFDNSL